MTMTCPCFLLALVTMPSAASGHAFLGHNPELQAKAVREELRGVLAEVLGHGHNVDSSRLASIRAALAPIFRTLPKNGQARLSAPVMRYAVQRYFSQRHGWIVK